ncbi:MAG: metallophosphoesterase [Bacteroidales bacterium]|nr:metallophosphoesterase [Candidatus Liminaster caballi]
MRILFPLILVGILLIICAIIDQIFIRVLRLFVEHRLSNIIRFSLMAFWAVLIVGGVLWGHYITRLQVEVREAEIVSSRVPESMDGLRIVHISDFHIGSMNSAEGRVLCHDIIDRILELKPDMVCFTGDIVTIRSAELRPFLPELKRLGDSGIPVYSILGNHDYADYQWDFTPERRQQDVDSLRQMQTAAGWQMLDNRSVWFSRGSDSILITGVGNIGEPPFTTYGSLSDAMQEVGGIAALDSVFTVLLSHNPRHWRDEVLPRTRIDLMLAGHTHAWQFRIFGWSPSRYKYPECDGLYSESENRSESTSLESTSLESTSLDSIASRYLYVNTGLGCTGPTVRIGVKPEITLLRLVRK